MFFCVFSLSLCFVSICFYVFAYPHSFMFNEQLSHLPYGFFGVGVTD